MNSNQKPKLKDIVFELASCKKMLQESENERKDVSKDYLELVKKFNVVTKENSILREENSKLRKKLDERKGDN